MKCYESGLAKVNTALLFKSCLDWAERYYTAVRLVGDVFYDADPTKLGIQTLYTDVSWLGIPFGPGIARNNS